MWFTSAQSITLSSFNPFIYFGETGKGHEIHLPDLAPTKLATTATLGTFADNSNSATGRNYKTKPNLPFALNSPESFAYPKKNDIVTAHLKYAAWAQSEGTLFQNWYKNLSNYRTSSKIY
jgi:LruC domain-containing protein